MNARYIFRLRVTHWKMKIQKEARNRRLPWIYIKKTKKVGSRSVARGFIMLKPKIFGEL